MNPGKLTWWMRVLLLVALLCTALPLYWVLMTSIKPVSEWNASPPIWVTRQPTLANYQSLFDPSAARGGGIGGVSESASKAVRDSLVLTICSTLVSVFLGLMAALAISRYNAGGKSGPLSILSGRMFPPAAIAVPFLIMFSSVRLHDTYLGLFLIYVAATLPFSTWMLKSFVDDLPKEIEEAAMLDGLSRIHAHLKFTLPLIKGGLVSTALFIFILNWSEFLFALVLSSDNVITIPRRLAQYFDATAGTLFGLQAALAVLAAFPLVVAGYFIQGYLVRGMTFGAIKR